MDLSYTLGKNVNNAIDPEMSSLTYIKVDDIANQVAQMSKGTLLAKMDVEEAYSQSTQTIDTSWAFTGMVKCTWMLHCLLVFVMPFLYSLPWQMGYNGFCNSRGHLSLPIT